jgi:hypothetical protein
MFNKETQNTINTIRAIHKLNRNNPRYIVLLMDFVSTYCIVQVLNDSEFDCDAFEKACFAEGEEVSQSMVEAAEAVMAEPVEAEVQSSEPEAENAPERVETLDIKDLPPVGEKAVIREPSREEVLRNVHQALDSLPLWDKVLIPNLWKGGTKSVHAYGNPQKMYFKVEPTKDRTALEVVKIPKPLQKLAKERANYIRKMTHGKTYLVESFGHEWYTSAYALGLRAKVKKVGPHTSEVTILGKR